MILWLTSQNTLNQMTGQSLAHRAAAFNHEFPWIKISGS
jgi:hypothetical protein